MLSSLNIVILCTDIQSRKTIGEVAPFLDMHPHIHKWSIDIEDCDKVLRIETDCLTENEISDFLLILGVHCSELQDI
ncbi:MAG: hypothetical protein JXQ87_04380 [Bacteroidia bacterium]